MKYLCLIVSILLLAACGTSKISTPSATPQAINIYYSSSLTPWAGKLGICASKQPDIAPYFMENPSPDQTIQVNEVVIQIGYSPAITGTVYASQVGWEQIAVIVNNNNPTTRLSTEEIQAIFSGQGLTWVDGSGDPIQVWVFPIGDPIRTIFTSAVMKGIRFTSQAMLAPDPVAMLDAIANDVNAIGFIPESILSTLDTTPAEKVHLIQLDPSLENTLHQPITALTVGEPQGVLRDLFICLEDNGR